MEMPIPHLAAQAYLYMSIAVPTHIIHFSYLDFTLVNFACGS